MRWEIIKKTYIIPSCTMIQSCYEQALANVSGTGTVNQPGQGGSFAKENTWTFDETEEDEDIFYDSYDTSYDSYFEYN